MSRLVQSVLLLPARIKETSERKVVLLHYNAKESEIMELLLRGLKRINALGVQTLDGKRLEFDIAEEI